MRLTAKFSLNNLTKPGDDDGTLFEEFICLFLIRGTVTEHFPNSNLCFQRKFARETFGWWPRTNTLCLNAKNSVIILRSFLFFILSYLFLVFPFLVFFFLGTVYLCSMFVGRIKDVGVGNYILG
jgi:hypothetical protein